MPVTLLEPASTISAPGPAVPSFAVARERQRLTPPAVRAVSRLAGAWGIGNADSAALLGVSQSTWDRVKAGRWDGVLSQDQLLRASALIGVYKGLHLLFADTMADRWPTLRNRGRCSRAARRWKRWPRMASRACSRSVSISTRCVAASDTEGALEGRPIVRAAFPRTVRLVATARLREPVLASLADTPEDLAALAEIEGATSRRLMAEGRKAGSAAIGPLRHDAPHAAFINASFAYAKPRQASRFNPPERGAWYAALAVATCVAEVGFHLTRALADAGDFNAVVDYAEMWASLAGLFVDLRGRAGDPCLDPDLARGYAAGNALAAHARGEGLNGIIYPSVRQVGGTCLAALWPHVVQSVRQGEVVRLVWAGSAEFRVKAA